MKKILSALALVALSASALAEGTTVGLTYDVDGAGSNSRGFKNKMEGHAFIAQQTSVGTFDVGGTGFRFRGKNTSDYAEGFEVGYGNSIALNQVKLLGRVGYGQVYDVDTKSSGFTSNGKYWVASVEAQAPLFANVNGFVNYRHREGTGSAVPVQNKYSTGVDFAVDKTTSLRIGVAHASEAAYSYNGVTSAIAFNF